MDMFPTYLDTLQQTIIKMVEAEENGATFTLNPWQKEPGDKLQGHGTTALLRGHALEKMGVNTSHVRGTFPEPFRKEIPGAEESGGNFDAHGISLVAHPANPFAPAVHFNVRRITTSKTWYGGGIDLTPTFPFEEDANHFHTTLQNVCEQHLSGHYEKYKKWCAEYFFLPHRNEERGIGGIFFDYLEPTATLTPQTIQTFTQAVGEAFLPAWLPLLQKRTNTPFTAEHKATQNQKRGRYAEFNLLYDRGTRFGLQTGGNTEAILMSLPPTATW